MRKMVALHQWVPLEEQQMLFVVKDSQPIEHPKYDYHHFQKYATTTDKIHGVLFAMDCHQSNRIFVF